MFALPLRLGLFLLTNILIMFMITIVIKLLGLDAFLSQMGIPYSSLMAMCFVWGMGGSFISLLISKFMAKRMMGVKVIDPNNADSEALWVMNTVHQLAAKAGIKKMPEVGIYQSQEVNAFATGPTKNNSLVAVSSGLLQRMDKDEVEGVLGHEIAHVANGDMVTMTLVQGVVNAFVMFLARIAAIAVSNAMRSDDRESSHGGGGFMHFAMVMVFQTVFGFFGMMVVGWFSRYREFRADRGGAELAGRKKMIQALQRLAGSQGLIDPKPAQAIASLKISGVSHGLAKLFATHPPLESRIQKLQSYGL